MDLQYFNTKSFRTHSPFLKRHFQFNKSNTRSKTGYYCPNSVALHPHIANCPFATQKSLGFFLDLIQCHFEKQNQKKQAFKKNILLSKKRIWNAEKIHFKKTDILLTKELFIFSSEDNKKMQKLLKVFGIKLLRLLKNFQNQQGHLFYIDCLLVFEFLVLPRYDLEAWEKLMIKRTEMRFKHQNGWQIVFFLVKKPFYWQIFALLHKKVFGPFLLQPSYYFFAYSSLIPNYGVKICTFLLNISVISYCVIFLNTLFKTFLFRWILGSFCLYVVARFFYFFTHPDYQKKGGPDHGNEYI